jgi:hypothetical protein
MLKKLQKLRVVDDTGSIFATVLRKHTTYMKLRISKRFILLLGFVLALLAIYSGGLVTAHPMQDQNGAASLDSGRVSNKVRSQIVEQALSHKGLITDSRLDFSLTPTGRSEFELAFENPYKYPVKIKIYNIIGNLIAEEEAKPGASFTKKYNFSDEKMRLFVVEVGNQKHNLTKKVTTI